MQRVRQRRLSMTAAFQHHSFRVRVRAARRPSLRIRPLTENLGLPEAPDGSLAAHARIVLVRSHAPLQGEGVVVAEPPSVGGVPAQHAEQMAAIVAADTMAAIVAAKRKLLREIDRLVHGAKEGRIHM